MRGSEMSAGSWELRFGIRSALILKGLNMDSPECNSGTGKAQQTRTLKGFNAVQAGLGRPAIYIKRSSGRRSTWAAGRDMKLEAESKR